MLCFAFLADILMLAWFCLFSDLTSRSDQLYLSYLHQQNAKDVNYSATFKLYLKVFLQLRRI